MLVTSIGSLPFTEVDRAIDLVFNSCPEVPFSPQLPKRSFYEGMYVQCLENIPSVNINEGTGTVFVDTTQTDGIEQFYEDVFNKNTAPFAVSPQAFPGFYRLLERLAEIRDKVTFVKSQLTGPFTIGMGLKDGNGKPIIYDSAYFDIIKKGLHMKAEWLIKTIRAAHPDKKVIIFFDEPAMVSFGSAFVSISKEEAISLFDEVIEGLDANVGIHCCGNTDWSVLLNTKVDIINYDAFNFMDTLFYFRDELSAFLERGGRIAPGIVPSSGEALDPITPADLHELWRRFKGLLLETAGTEGDESIVTTACGLGSLAEGEALKALDLLSRLPVVTAS